MPSRAVIWCAVSSKVQAQDDKVSLSMQEEEARRWCETNGYEIVDVLKVPGYSRRESDVLDAMEEFASQGIYAYHDLRQAWKSKAFDVLVAYSYDRLGRSNTLTSHVVENVILSGARIYLIADGGFIDPETLRYKMAIGGMMAAAPIDQFVKKRKAGMRRRAERGLPVGSIVALSHRVIRNELGEAQKLVVNESLRRLWDDLARCILDGVSWFGMERALFERYGHASEKGVQYKEQFFYKLVHKPAFWGHTAMNLYHRALGEKELYGAWVFDKNEPAPEGVTIFYDTHEPVYAGDLAESVKNELRRRKTVIRGNARTGETHAFSGLLICAECGFNLIYTSPRPSWAGYVCVTNQRRQRTRESCSQSRRSIRLDTIQRWFENALRQMVASSDPHLFARQSMAVDPALRLESIDAEIAQAEAYARQLIVQQARLPEELQPISESEIIAAGERLKMLRAARAQAARAASTVESDSRERAYRELLTVGIENFWGLPEMRINQILFGLLGNVVVAVSDRRIDELRERPVRRRR